MLLIKTSFKDNSKVKSKKKEKDYEALIEEKFSFATGK